MNQESGIKIFIHPPSGDLALSYQVYGCTRVTEAYEIQIPTNIKMEAYQYIGVAVENKNGVVCLFHENYLEHFEFVGFL